MKIRSYILGTAAALVSSLVLSAAASPLVQRDLLTPGDGLLTYDPMSGAEWLDMSATAGMSYKQVLASDFCTKYGFKPAYSEKVLSFVANAVPAPRSTDRWGSEADMLADPWAHQVMELYALWSGDPNPKLDHSDYHGVLGVLADSFRVGDSEPFHFSAKWRWRMQHYSTDDWWQLDFERRPTDFWPSEDQATPGVFLARAPEQVDTLWLLLPVTGSLFLGRVRSAAARRIQA